MADIEKVIKGLEEISSFLFREYGKVHAEETNLYHDRFLAVEDACAILKEQKAEHDRTMKVIWDTLHEGLSIDTVADQDWVYEQIRHKIEDK